MTSSTQIREQLGDHRVHRPVDERAERLSLGPYSVGKISLMNTQMTVPCPTACAAMNTMSLPSTAGATAPRS